MLTKEKALIVSFLDVLSEILSSNCCNDWSFPEDWSQAEKYNFVREYHEYNGDPETFDGNHLHLPDFSVISLLAHKLLE